MDKLQFLVLISRSAVGMGIPVGMGMGIPMGMGMGIPMDMGMGIEIPSPAN